jgi:hypothetical protein
MHFQLLASLTERPRDTLDEEVVYIRLLLNHYLHYPNYINIS